MKLSKTILIIHIVALLLGNAAFAADSVPGELLVKYRAGIYSQSLTGELAKIGWAKIRVADDEPITIEMESLRNSSDILVVEPNTYGQFLSEPGG